MKIIKKAQAGTFESSDILILVEPVSGNSGRKIEIDSTVMKEYGESIKELINSCLDSFHIQNIHLIAKDKGALKPTIQARIETALKRASQQ
ncbi:MAG: citrate lyase acyl carrier protein [Flavobacteriia bacterium]|nr:MAG: citrate lyase acyl carrier protein [Flavobacteriia bacterium]